MAPSEPAESLSTRRRQSRHGRPARSVLAWSAVSYLALQLLFVIWADLFQPVIYDPEFSDRIALLRARHAEQPEQPYVLVLGSSRMVLGFRPERLPTLTAADGRVAVPFNFSHTAAGPVYNLLAYRRLIREGLGPTWLVIEIMPLLMREEWLGVYATSAVARELPALTPHTSPGRLYWGYVKNRLTPWRQHRHMFMKLNFPEWLPPLDHWAFQAHSDRLGGEIETATTPSAPPNAAQLVRAAREKNGMLFDQFTVNPLAESALRRLLEECKRDGVQVALLLGPESPEFHRHYSPTALDDLKEYGQRLCREYDGRWIDAHDWLQEEHFMDGHHMCPSGQARFTDRLGKDVLANWLREGAQVVPESTARNAGASLKR